MKNTTAKRYITLYNILSTVFTVSLLIPIFLIQDLLLVTVYLVCFPACMRIAISFTVRITIMRPLLKELDAEKYTAVISAYPFRFHYSYKLISYIVTGDYQSAYNIISSVLLEHKNIQQRIYGYLLLCRICFERRDYEELKNYLDEIDTYFKNDPQLKLSKQNKESYAFYRAFSDADYVSACTLLEKIIAKESKKKNGAYFSLMPLYQLAVIKRMNGNVEEAVSLFKTIQEKAPKLAISTLAQKQLEYISGALEEKKPENLEITEIEPVKSDRKKEVILIIAVCVSYFLIIMGKSLMQFDTPKQENKDQNYIAQIENTLEDDYDEHKILGYFNIYTDYADHTYTMIVDSLFLVETNGRLDLHTLYQLNGEYQNNLNVKAIQVDQLYAYRIASTTQTVTFVLTEKERNIPKNTLYYYEIDGYYFCVISICDKGSTMNFNFESLQDTDLLAGSSYFMDFGEMHSQEDAAIAEGKLLAAFGKPAHIGENYENSFNYVIQATANDGKAVILSVYGMGVIHIGAAQQDDFAADAAAALIEYVNTFAPADYERTVYYLDFNLQIDIQVKNGNVTLKQSGISEEKAAELFGKWYQ